MESRGSLAPAFLLVLFRRMFWVELLIFGFSFNNAYAYKQERKDKPSEY